jgi:hypothetical protein
VSPVWLTYLPGFTEKTITGKISENSVRARNPLFSPIYKTPPALCRGQNEKTTRPGNLNGSPLADSGPVQGPTC